MTLLADRYELAEPLGSGGMAQVLAATDRRLGRRVAVKLMREDLRSDPSARIRLLNEARTAAAFHHPHAVAVFDVGEEDGRPFVVMELVEGETLRDRLDRDGTLPVADTAAVGVALLAALGAAHRRGLVHRDVKPANILLPDGGGVKLADFGIAKALEQQTAGLTATGQIIGTPSYLSPEQASGLPAGPRSDLYALGVVLYECLAGGPPFTGDNAVSVALAHQRDPVPPLAKRAPEAPAEVAAVIERALAKDPEDRFADAPAMRRALEQAAQGVTADPTLAIPPAAAVASTDDEVGPTEVLTDAPAVEPAPIAGRRTGRRLGAVAAVIAVLALLAVLALSGLLGDEGDGEAPTDDVDEPADPPAEEPDAPPADEPDEPPGDEPDDEPDEEDVDDEEDVEEEDVEEEDPPGEGPPDDPGPPDEDEEGALDDLLSALAADPGAAGDRGDDLLDELLEVRRAEEDDDRREDARELIKDVGGWIADGELRRRVGRDAIDALEPVARPPDEELAAASGLFADVAKDKRGWGDKADELLSDLEDLLDEDDPDDWREDAEELLAAVEGWVEEGELHQRRSRDATDVLAAVASGQAAATGDAGARGRFPTAPMGNG